MKSAEAQQASAAGAAGAAVAPLAIIYKYYPQGSPQAELLIRHSRRVTEKALAVARRLARQAAGPAPDLDFIAAAAMLHDIGIFRTAAPSLHCNGSLPYVCHGIIGRRILTEEHGLAACGLVCERHVGVGILVEDIRQQNLPLPLRDMQPVSLEEKIICYADKFFSKTIGDQELTPAAIVAELGRFGAGKAARFLEWHSRFEGK